MKSTGAFYPHLKSDPRNFLLETILTKLYARPQREACDLLNDDAGM